MREIKFRVWDEYRRFMDYEPYGLGGQGDYTVCINSFTKQHSEFLMQYTGLVDKNGREIYEGDILPYGYVVTFVDASDSANLGMSVGWYEQRYNFESFRQLEVGDELEVIGNIYENPELLEEVK